MSLHVIFILISTKDMTFISQTTVDTGEKRGMQKATTSGTKRTKGKTW